jgi:hypothetical protein
MHGISGRTLVIAHLAGVLVFCLLGVIGYGVVLAILRAFSGVELADLHRDLQSNKLVQEVFSASIMSLSAIAAGRIAAKISNTKPLTHGVLSVGVFSLFFLCGLVYDIFEFPKHITLFFKSPEHLSELTLPLFGAIGAATLMVGRRESSDERSVSMREDNDLLGDLEPIAWKWLVRLIWLSSIVTFQVIEALRYWNGETYRPFFGLYTSLICALVIWYAAHMFRDVRQRNRARCQTRLNVG